MRVAKGGSGTEEPGSPIILNNSSLSARREGRVLALLLPFAAPFVYRENARSLLG